MNSITRIVSGIASQMTTKEQRDKVKTQTSLLFNTYTKSKIFYGCHTIVFSISTNKSSNFQSHTTVHLLWLSYIFWTLFGPSSGYCIKLLKIKVKHTHNIHFNCDLTKGVYFVYGCTFNF